MPRIFLLFYESHVANEQGNESTKEEYITMCHCACHTVMVLIGADENRKLYPKHKSLNHLLLAFPSFLNVLKITLTFSGHLYLVQNCCITLVGYCKVRNRDQARQP